MAKFSIQDLVTLASSGWTPKATKEVLEMISSMPDTAQTAAPEELKAKAEIKEVEELPKAEEAKAEPVEEDLLGAFKKLMEE